MTAALLLVAFGITGGIVTTLAGLGGGVLMVNALALALGPAAALAATTPALLCGNLHRAFAMRRSVDTRTAVGLGLGTFAGSVVGGFFAAAIPTRALAALLLGSAAWTTWSALRPRRATPLGRWLVPAGLAVGTVGGSVSGAGVLLGPLLLGAGLTGEAYVGTSAAISVTMHLGRSLAYGTSGLYDPTTLGRAAVLAASVLVGNRIGLSLRPRLTPAFGRRLETGAVLACTAFAVLGLALPRPAASEPLDGRPDSGSPAGSKEVIHDGGAEDRELAGG